MSDTTTDPTTDVSADPKAVARRLYATLDDHDPSALRQVCAPDLVGHAGAGADLDELIANWEGFVAAFPDLAADVRHLVCEGDTVAGWVTYEATHDGPFAGVPATGRRVRFTGWDLMVVADGRIVELTQYCDLFTILNQIGALATATPA